jgi:hypothetical protein
MSGEIMALYAGLIFGPVLLVAVCAWALARWA